MSVIIDRTVRQTVILQQVQHTLYNIHSNFIELYGLLGSKRIGIGVVIISKLFLTIDFSIIFIKKQEVDLALLYLSSDCQ